METWRLGQIDSKAYKLYNSLRNSLNCKLASYLHTFIADTDNMAIIEAGSGPGYCASLLKRYKNIRQAVILDLDHTITKLARERDRSLEAIDGNLLTLPFLKNSFDLVYNSSTIEHIDNYQQAFAEIVRVCKPGGFIFIGIPHKYGPLFPFSLFPRNGSISIWIGRFISRQEILLLAGRFPLELIDELFYFCRFFRGFLFKKSF